MHLKLFCRRYFSRVYCVGSKNNGDYATPLFNQDKDVGEKLQLQFDWLFKEEKLYTIDVN